MSKTFETPDSFKSVQATGKKPLVITVKGCGNIPSFKNAKRAILDSKTGNLRTLTEKSVAKRVKKIQAAIVCALRSVLAIEGDGIQTDVQRQSWMRFVARLKKFDDCWTCVPELIIMSELCKPGEEGFTITIERLD